jgi:TolB protein
MVYIGYPAGTPNHNPRTVAIELKLTSVKDDKVVRDEKTLVKATGGQGTMNVNSWSPDSTRFAYVTYEALP